VRYGFSSHDLSGSSLREPTALLTVAVDARVLAQLEHDLVVAAIERLLRPPAVDDAPLLPHEGDLLAVDDARSSVDPGLDERRPRRVEAPRGRVGERMRAAGPGAVGGAHAPPPQTMTNRKGRSPGTVGYTFRDLRYTKSPTARRARAFPEYATTVPPPPLRTRSPSRCWLAPVSVPHAAVRPSRLPPATRA